VLGGIEDLVTLGCSLTRDQVSLIVAIEMNLVVLTPHPFAFLKLIHNVCIASGCNEGREPVEPRYDRVLDLASRHVPGPTDDTGHSESTFERRPFPACERRLPAVRPGKILSAVVCRESNDRVVVKAIVLHIFHDRADNVV